MRNRLYFGARRTLLLALCLLPSCPVHADPGDALDTGGGGVAQRYVWHAEDALIHGRVTEALQFSDHAISEYPHYMFAHRMRGAALLYSARYDEAEAEFAGAIAAWPEYPDLYIEKGVALLDQRKPDLAVQAFNQAMTARTGIDVLVAGDVFIYRSLAFEMLGRAPDAIADFADGLKTLYGIENNYTVLAFGCRAGAISGLLESAVMQCDESIKMNAHNEMAYEGRALAELKQKNYAKAIADYTQALYFQDDNSFDLYGRGAARHALGDRAGGDADIAAAASHEPHIEEIMIRLGVSASGPVM